MSRIACKFGGSSLADAAQFRKVRSILDSDTRRSVIVVSAPGRRNQEEAKLTDLLYQCHGLAQRRASLDVPFAQIRDRFLGIAKELGLVPGLAAELDGLRGE